MTTIYFHCEDALFERIKSEFGNDFELISRRNDPGDKRIDFAFIDYKSRYSIPEMSLTDSLNVIFSTTEKNIANVLFVPPENPGIAIYSLMNYLLKTKTSQLQIHKSRESERVDLLSRAIYQWSTELDMNKFLKNVLRDELKLIKKAYGGSIWIREGDSFYCAASLGLNPVLLNELRFKEEEIFRSQTDEAAVIVSKNYNSGLPGEKKELIGRLGTLERHITLVGNISVRGKLYGNICIDSYSELGSFDGDDINIHSFYSRIVSKFIEERLLRQETGALLKKLEASEIKFRTLSENTDSYIFIIKDGKMVYSNPSIKKLFNKDRQIENMITLEATRVFENNTKPDYHGELEIEIMGKKRRWFKFNTSLIDFDEGVALLCHGNEITQTRNAYDKIKYMAMHDPMTNLYNRSYFQEEMSRLKNNRFFPISILVGDLNNMKATNDSLGHAQGDRLIKNTARMLKNSFRSCDVVARIGGDEFAVILPGTSSSSLKYIYDRLIANMAVFNKNRRVKIDMAIGYATQNEGESIYSVMNRADSQMYETKRRSKINAEAK